MRIFNESLCTYVSVNRAEYEANMHNPHYQITQTIGHTRYEYKYAPLRVVDIVEVSNYSNKTHISNLRYK